MDANQKAFKEDSVAAFFTEEQLKAWMNPPKAAEVEEVEEPMADREDEGSPENEAPF